jgi:tetratricopeptide (TPR) repeat protein
LDRESHKITTEKDYQRLMSLSDLPPDSEAAMRVIGQLIDAAGDLRREEGIKYAIDLCRRLEGQQLTPHQEAILKFCEGNAWSHLRIFRRSSAPDVWEWEQPEIEREIVCLRLATRGNGIQGFPTMRLCQIYTNLGNTLNTIGRFVEAIGYWQIALRLDNVFSMALGNLGKGLFSYARALYDDGHRAILLAFAYRHVKQALEGNLHPDARSAFKSLLDRLEKLVPMQVMKGTTDLNDHSLGETKGEIEYRRWCLGEVLFLNPLNDLGHFPIAAVDPLTAPTMAMPVRAGPYYHGFYNALKQEYASARFLAYDGLNTRSAHFSDRRVLLYNTFDYPTYGLGVERLKAAFRMAFSLFDKIAFFLNDYLGLGIPERQVSFRGLWYVNCDPKRDLRPEFAARENWPLRGLYWLAKDIYTDEPGFRDALDPEAQRMKEVRNQLEHKYLKIHEMGPPKTGKQTARDAIFIDELAYSIKRDEFEGQTVKLLRLARAALIYLSLGVHAEEQRRRTARGDTSIPSMPLDTWEDKWKV